MLNPHVMLILFQQLLSETEETTYTISKLNNIHLHKFEYQ